MTQRLRWAMLLGLLPIASLAGVIYWEWSSVVRLNRPREGRSDRLADFSHEPWNDLLSRHVDAQGRVAYRRWKESPADVQMLDDYLQAAGDVVLRPDDPRKSILAYWINLYNAVTVRGILREYPTRSILDHVRPVGYHFWKDLRLFADGAYRSLDDIEHGILRPMHEPRIHFAIVCASVGCPWLRNEAYAGDRLDAQLTESARLFLARSDTLRPSADGSTLYLTSLLKWFGTDFGPTLAEQLAAIAPYAPEEYREPLFRRPPPPVAYLEYDWSLNDQTEDSSRSSAP